MSKTAVINLSSGAWYPAGQQRLLESLRTSDRYTGDVLLYGSEASVGSPTHAESHYAFKVYALEMAQKLGYEQIIWCDSSIQALKRLDPIWEMISQDGYFFLDNGNMVGQWSSDESIKAFGLDRETALTMKELTTCVFGLDLRRPEVKDLIENFKRCTLEGLLHKDWGNNNNQVSCDERVKGHRHDQTIICLLAHMFGLTNFRQGYLWYHGSGSKLDSAYFMNWGGF